MEVYDCGWTCILSKILNCWKWQVEGHRLVMSQCAAFFLRQCCTAWITCSGVIVWLHSRKSSSLESINCKALSAWKNLYNVQALNIILQRTMKLQDCCLPTLCFSILRRDFLESNQGRPSRLLSRQGRLGKSICGFSYLAFHPTEGMYHYPYMASHHKLYEVFTWWGDWLQTRVISLGWASL